MELIYQTQSEYNLIRVFQEEDEFWLRLGGGSEIHSIFRPGEYILEEVGEYYWNFFNMLPLMKKQAKKILILGLGCGTLSRQLLHYFPELEIEGVEIDEKVIEVGVKFFELVQTNLVVHVVEGIEFLKKDDEKYDLIILDAFTKGNVNPAFINEETFRLIKSRLVEDGIFGLNYLNESLVARNIKKHAFPLFKQIVEIPVKACYNKVIFASDKKYELGEIYTDNMDLRKVRDYVVKIHKVIKSS